MMIAWLDRDFIRLNGKVIFIAVEQEWKPIIFK